jgi:hypothetical protein
MYICFSYDVSVSIARQRPIKLHILTFMLASAPDCFVPDAPGDELVDVLDELRCTLAMFPYLTI